MEVRKTMMNAEIYLKFHLKVMEEGKKTEESMKVTIKVRYSEKYLKIHLKVIEGKKLKH